MDEKDGCHTVWLAKEFKWLDDKKKFNRWDVIKYLNGSQKCQRKLSIAFALLLLHIY